MDDTYAYLTADLKVNCPKCSGLCCVALYCRKMDGFPANKEAGKPCKHLLSDFRCAIYPELITKKMRGCLAYDCFGAGQKTTQYYFPDSDWKVMPKQRDEIFRTFAVVFQLHQMLWYLIQAFSLASDEHLKSAIEVLILENEKMTHRPPQEILQLDIEHRRLKVNKVLKQLINMITRHTSQAIRNHDYSGQDFNRGNLDGRDLSMTLMIAANLEACSLKRTILLGADMRGANLKDTDLSESVFLTQMQINSAIGNSNTKIPVYLSRPNSWQGV